MLPQLENLARIAAVLTGAHADESPPAPIGPASTFPIFGALRREKFVFAGASILPLLLDDDFDRPLRRTDDTDVVVSVLHYGEWQRLRDALVAAGFRERADDRHARQILFWFDGLPVDFIPARMAEFGTANRWLSLGFDLAETAELETGQSIWRLSASAWLAAKIAAFEQRGRRDVLMSRDLEDIVTLLIGRRSLAEEIRYSQGEIRAYIIEAFRAWLRDNLVLDAMDGSVSSAADRHRLDAIRNEIAEL